MKSIKVLSGISFVFYFILFLFLQSGQNILESAVVGAIALILLFAWGLIFTIIVYVLSYSSKPAKAVIEARPDYNSELLKLFELKEKGILTNEEFEEKKTQILYILRTDLRATSK